MLMAHCAASSGVHSNQPLRCLCSLNCQRQQQHAAGYRTSEGLGSRWTKHQISRIKRAVLLHINSRHLTAGPWTQSTHRTEIVSTLMLQIATPYFRQLLLQNWPLVLYADVSRQDQCCCDLVHPGHFEAESPPLQFAPSMLRRCVHSRPRQTRPLPATGHNVCIYMMTVIWLTADR
jgi:hypothetical protein